MLSDAFTKVSNLLVAVHRLIRSGDAESDDADVLRDDLERAMRRLTADERYQAQWLSEDLYSVSGPVPPGAAAAPADLSRNAAEAFEAREAGDWRRALALLRKVEPFVPPGMVSRVRGGVWSRLGQTDVAATFFGHASEREPDNANIKALHLISLTDADVSVGRRAAESFLQRTPDGPPVVVIHAAKIVLDATETLQRELVPGVCRRLIDVLTPIVTGLENATQDPAQATLHALALAILGSCYEQIDDRQRAESSYSRALELEPDNDALRVSRGILMYGSDTRAIGDLEYAAKQKSPLVWPYLFLAHHLFHVREFDACRRECERGLEKDADPDVRSQLEEWRAIAEAESDFPPEIVRKSFEAAIRLNPASESAKRNYHVYQASLTATPDQQVGGWQQWSNTDVRDFGLERATIAFAATI